MPPDEATRDCQENEADTDFITIAREECDDEVKSGDDEDYTYEYEEEHYEDGEEYENFEPGAFFQQAVDQFEEFQSGDIEYDYELPTSLTDPASSDMPGMATLSRKISLHFIAFLPGRRFIPITMSCVLMRIM